MALDPALSREQFLSLLDGMTVRDDVALSFHDGNASDVEYALPELRALTERDLLCRRG